MNSLAILGLCLLTSAPNTGLDPASIQDPSSEQAPGSSVNAEALRARIRQMRMNMLVGGERVQEAEREAVTFYSGKADSVDQRLDTLNSDLSETRASYDVILDRALAEQDPKLQQRALAEAQPLRNKLSAIQNEASGLQEKRENLSNLISSVASREDERRRLVNQIESAEAIPDSLGVPFAGIGLAPSVAPVSSGSPLENQALLGDLLDRDPVAARRLLFNADPDGYWQQFPLQPPAGVLSKALRFPLPDLPGRR